MAYVWLAAFVLLLVAESLTVALTCIWFAGGAVAAMAAAILGAGFQLQLGVFVLVSLLLLLLVRPVAVRCLRTRRRDTNVDGLVGRTAIVKERIDNVRGEGSATLAGETWLARSAAEDEILEPGTAAVVTAVRGAKLILAAQK